MVRTQEWLHCGAQNYDKDIKNRCDFTRHWLYFSRFYASTLLRFYASTLLRFYVPELETNDSKDYQSS